MCPRSLERAMPRRYTAVDPKESSVPMKTLSTLALAAALTTGAIGVAPIAPAAAQKKKEEVKSGLKPTPALLKIAAPAQTALAADNIAVAEPAIVQIEAAATTPDDKYIAAALRYELEQRRILIAQRANPNAPVNETALAAPLDALLANPVTPAADKGKFAYRRGALAYNGKQYPIAVQYFTQARQFGYAEPNLGLQLAQAKVLGGDVAGGLAELDADVTRQTAAGQKPGEDLYRFGIARANQAKLAPQTVTWMQRYLTAYPTSKNWRDVIVTYGLAGQSIAKLTEAQQIDLLRLMRATRAMADQNDYIEYAANAQKRGLPIEAQAVLREGIASGKIPAGNTEAKALLAETTASARAETAIAVQETRANAAANGRLAASTADVYLGMDNFAKAASFYRIAMEKGGVDADEINTRLGIALARSGDKAGAKAAFASVQGTPRTGIAALWTTYVDAAPTA